MQEWLAGRGPGPPCLEHWMSPLEPGAVSEGGEWEAEGREGLSWSAWTPS